MNPNSSVSTNLSSRICSAKPKITTFIKFNETSEQSTIAPHLQKTVSDYARPLNSNLNENNMTSSMLGSPINECLIVGTKSFINDNDGKENLQKKKKRVMSAKYERHCYLKIKDKSSFDDGSSSLGLFENTYKPKQLTTDKCKFSNFFQFNFLGIISNNNNNIFLIL